MSNGAAAVANDMIFSKNAGLLYEAPTSLLATSFKEAKPGH
jgi:hypothetical protein